ncbi:MAG: SLC13 family permease [Actinomycetota bacterium]
MSTDAALTLAVLVAMFGLLIRDRFPPSGVLLAGLTALVLVDAVAAEAAFAGFANPAPLTVAALYVVAGGARRTGLLAGTSAKLLDGDGGRSSLARLCLPVAGLSGLFNNTPLVAMLLPEVTAWARRNRLPVSRFLMPLSFAAILGGTVTVIGTSTSLVVSGVLQQQGDEPLGLFEQSPVALPAAALGLVVLIGPVFRWLPTRSDLGVDAIEALREFAVHLVVETDGPLVGRSVADAGLRNLSGVFLADVVRGDRHIGPVSPDEVLEADDLLIFVGDVTDVIDLRSRPGLRPAIDEGDVLDQAREPRYFEAVVGRESPLVSRTLREVGGRSGYRATAVAIHRAGVPLTGKLGEVELHAGDTLILLAGSDLRRARGAMQDFLVLAPINDAVAVVGKRARWVALALAAFVALAGLGILSTFEASLVAAAIVVGTKVLSFAEAKGSVNLDIVVMIAAALGIGAAVEGSGLAADLAGWTTGALDPFGRVGVVVGVLVATVVLTELVTNSAAAAVVVPIALRAAESVDLDPRVMAVGIAVMASSSFLTPIGYQTNAMVYGPGGYRFIDFARVGAPVSLVVLAVTATLVSLLG